MKYKGVKYELFGGENEEAQNALHAAFAECAGGKEADAIYEWIEDTPKTTMIVLLCDKLREMGYQITEVRRTT